MSDTATSSDLAPGHYAKPEDATWVPAPTLLAEWLPQYHFGRLVAASARCASYTARHRDLDRPVMVRVIPGSTPEATAAFLMRIRQSAKVLDSQVAAIYDFGQTEKGPLYVVSEAVEGQTIRSLIHARKITPKRAYLLSLETCQVLQRVHDQGIACGALSSRSVYVTTDESIKLTGVGMTETSGGELSWTDTAYRDVPSDIAALGRLIHEMFIGHVPRGSVSDLLPKPFAEVIQRCVHVDPAQRYGRAKDVRGALVTALRLAKPKTPKITPLNPKVETPRHPATIVKPTPLPQQSSASTPSPGQPGRAASPALHPFHQPGPRAPLPPPRRSLGSRLANFFFNSIRFTLHFIITASTLAIVAAAYLFRGNLIIEEVHDEPSSPAPSAVRAPADSSSMGGLFLPRERPISTDLGALPSPQMLPVSPAPSDIGMATTSPPSPPSALEDLDAQYREAVQRETAVALERVKLDELPFYQAELKRLQAGAGVPGVDEPNLPVRLKQLRQVYREHRAKAQADMPEKR